MLPAEVPNAEFHFCAGDATKWSGIKRCGGAMRGGHFVAMNIHQHVLRENIGHIAVYGELQEIPPMIAMAVGGVLRPARDICRRRCYEQIFRYRFIFVR